MSTVATSEVLNRAADLIEKRGWTRGEGWNKSADTPLCLEGAIQAAAGLSWQNGWHKFYLECPAYDAVVDYLGLDPQPRLMPLQDAAWIWNDDHGSMERVVEVLRAVAVIEAARETEAAEVTA